MKPARRIVRHWLQYCSRRELSEAMHNAMLNNHQKELIIRKKKGWSNTRLAFYNHCDISVVVHDLSLIYDKLSTVIS